MLAAQPAIAPTTPAGMTVSHQGMPSWVVKIAEA